MTVCQPKRDENGEVLFKRNGQREVAKTDTESIAIGTDWKEYFAKEVLPHIDKDSWVDIPKTKVNYEINFTRYFYKHEQLPSSTEVASAITEREKRIQTLVSELFS